MKKLIAVVLLSIHAITGALPHIDYNAFDATKTGEFLKQFISHGDLVFDVGANVGKKTDLYLALGARAVCIEPQIECVTQLKHKFRANKNVVVEHKGLAAQKGTLELLKCRQADTLSTFCVEATKEGRFAQRNYNWDQRVLVDVSTLDAMIAQYGTPKFCKIDVEGFEYEVLKGLTQPIDYLSFECNSEHMAITKECVSYLTRLGYKKFNFAIGEQGWFAFDSWIDGTEFIEKLQTLAVSQDWEDIWGLWGDVYASYID